VPDKLLSPWHLWIRCRALEGTLDQGPDVGAWRISTQRILKGWGILNDEDYPFDAYTWPPTVVEGDQQKAKQNRITCYQIVRDASDGCAAIDRNGAFTAALTITDQWFNASNGLIDYPATGNAVGGHAVWFDRFGHESRKLRFANSWGTRWGHQGYGLLSYDFFNEYMMEGFTGYWAPRQHLPYTHGITSLQFGFKGFDNSVIHICETYRHRDDEILGWAFAVERGGYLEIEELFIKPSYRRQGLGSELCRLLRDVKKTVSLPLRAWVSHADRDAVNLVGVDAVLRKLGLERHSSPVTWASFVATEPGDSITPGVHPATPLARPKHLRFAR
jgi:GNAT superfamily N-acetyltransferase